MQIGKLHDVDAKSEALAELRRQGNPDPALGLSIVIPTYNAIGTVEPLLKQLVALPEVQRGEYEVIITDDASTDGTVAKLREKYPQFVYVESETNTGFGANANRGISHASKEGYVAVVNTDVELVGNPFPILLELLHRDPKLFAAMPLIFNTSRNQVENLQFLKKSRGLVWNADLPVQEHYTAGLLAGRTAGVDWQRAARGIDDGVTTPTLLCGAFFVTSWIRMMDGLYFDEDFSPFYWEDVDLGYQAAALGLKTFATSAAVVIHRHSETIDRRHGQRKLDFLQMNQLRFVSKWQHELALPARQLWLLLRSAKELLSGNPRMAGAYWASLFERRHGFWPIAFFWSDLSRK